MLSTEHFHCCIETLERSLDYLTSAVPGTVDYEVFRNATIKGFELTLETTGTLLRKVLKLYKADPGFVDKLIYKDVFRHALKHGLITEDALIRWFAYQDNRNNTAHNYGEAFANETVTMLAQFIKDAKALELLLQQNILSEDA